MLTVALSVGKYVTLWIASRLIVKGFFLTYEMFSSSSRDDSSPLDSDINKE